MALLCSVQGTVQASAAPHYSSPTSPRFEPQPPPFQYFRPGQPIPRGQAGERVLLTLEGAAKQTFTLKQLQAMPALRYTTYHPQLKRILTYEGVPLRDLAKQGGFLGKDLRVYASNGFVATIQARDYLYEPIMLAYKANNKAIPVLEKGPLTVVLPPRPARFSKPAYSAAWVWFAVRITPAP